MSRFRGIGFFAAFCALAGVTSCASDDRPSTVRSDGAKETHSRPNIIFLLADDQRADSLSVTGHPFVETPNIDQLARAGTRFENAFTAEPICAPSRFAFLSGQYERTSGLGFNSPYQVSEAQWQNTYPAQLQDAGYFTGFVGKFGVQYYDFEGGAASKFDYWRGHDGWLPFFPKDLPGNPATQIYRDADKNVVTEIMGEYAIEFLRSRPQDKAFSLSVSFSAPHNSMVSSMFPEGVDPQCDSRACEMMGHAANDNPKLKEHDVYGELYRDADVRMSDDVGVDPYQFIPEGIIDHEARKQWYAYNYDRSTEPEHLVRYHQTITGIDRVVGELVRELQAQGIADNTVIIYSSDHGLLNGEYGTGGKGLLYDLVARIPLIIYDPRAQKTDTGRVARELVMSLDVPSTILAFAGLVAPPQMQGRVLSSAGGVSPRSEVFLESLTVAEGNPFIEALRTDEWKYVRYLKPGGCPYTEDQLDFGNGEVMFEQLFHLPVDPSERENLIGTDHYHSVAEDFRARIAVASEMLTRESRAFKRAMAVPARPAEGVYCW